METLHPGLYFQEVAGTPPVEGVSTATAGFIGVAPKGRVGEPVLITNWSQYVMEFGSFIDNSYLAYAVRGFFENGGSRAYISRLVHYDIDEEGAYTKTSSPASMQLLAGLEPVANIDAKNDGAWGNDIKVEVVKGEKVGKFIFNVYYKNILEEAYLEVDLNSLEDETKNSRYITVVTISDTNLSEVEKTALAGGNDGITDIGNDDYLFTLKTFDATPITLLAIPGVTSKVVQTGMFEYTSNREDVFAITEVPLGLNVADARAYSLGMESDFGALYYPHIRVSDSIGLGKNPTKLVPPSGHIMGVIARMDNAVGAWRAPAGIDAKILGAMGLEYSMSDVEQDSLNPVGVNAIRAFDGEGICIWGTRTLSKGEFMYIPVRRTMNFIKQYLSINMRWALFRPNDEKLWGMIKSAVENFLNTIWAQGGLKGASASDAFFVKCDGELNTQDVIDEGRIYIDIGIAPQKPAEFIIFRISLKR